MREQFALAKVFDPEGSNPFFAKSNPTIERPSYEEPVRVGILQSNEPSVIREFGIQALVHDNQDVIALIENPGRMLFVRQEESDESSSIKKDGQANIKIGPAGIRLVDTKTGRQILIRLADANPIGAELEPPISTLEAEVALPVPK